MAANDTTKRSGRAAFWFIFLLLAVVCFGYFYPGYAKRANAQRTILLLQPMLSADERFRGIPGFLWHGWTRDSSRRCSFQCRLGCFARVGCPTGFAWPPW